MRPPSPWQRLKQYIRRRQAATLADRMITRARRRGPYCEPCELTDGEHAYWWRRYRARSVYEWTGCWYERYCINPMLWEAETHVRQRRLERRLIWRADPANRSSREIKWAGLYLRVRTRLLYEHVN